MGDYIYVRARDQCLAPNSVLAVFMIINFQTVRVRKINPGAWGQNGISVLSPGLHYPSPMSGAILSWWKWHVA